MTDRKTQLARLREDVHWDVVVVGGGATGLGVALDAAARGFSVALLEAQDFAKGTSSRATKLVHGGVRYLAQGNVSLVREALHERATLLHNAPHLAQPLAFVMPTYQWWETPFYGIGLKAYDALAGRRSLGATHWLSRAETQAALPNVRVEGLHGGVQYWDAQFDDARLAVTLARTAIQQGAVVLNHCSAVGLILDGERLCGLHAQDIEAGEEFKLRARCVVNATGVWVDAVRDMARVDPAGRKSALVAPSQGVHLVVDADFMPGGRALIVPKTADGRVLFAVPWMGKTLLGTTDTPREATHAEPRPLRAEVDFILTEAGRYMARGPSLADVRSSWAGLRPLVRHEEGEDSKAVSREHTVLVGRTGLVTVTGGKWTTYRAMAEDVLDRAFKAKLLPRRPAGVTETLRLVGASVEHAGSITQTPGLHLYGSEAETLAALPGADHWLWQEGHGGLSEAMVRFAVRFEMARTVEDILARRSRLLFLDAKRAAELAPAVAALLAEELGRAVSAEELNKFQTLAQAYATPIGAET